MAQAILQVEHLGKYYKIRHDRRDPYSTLTGTLTESGKEIFRTLLHPVRESRRRNAVEIFKALDDVSFEVNPGDRVGIIGRNGAGKSTLLKLLSRITEPDAGKITLRGRVASLLEVGTGFHPELTGRENIYLNGSILGMKHAEIRRKFDEIVDFSGVEAFLDTPVKRYSSGMYVRLAFAVAAHLEPEILLVDEVLAVGDMEFQKKCLGKMDEISRTEGRTILFVSHNMEAIQRLCNKALLLESGKLALNTSCEKAILRYTASLNAGTGLCLSDFRTRKNTSSGEILFQDLQMHNLSGAPLPATGDDLRIRLRFKTAIPGEVYRNAVLSMTVRNLFHPMFNFQLNASPDGKPWSIRDGDTLEFRIPHLPLTEGNYQINLFVGQAYSQADYLENIPLQVAGGRFFPDRPNCAEMHKGNVTLIPYDFVQKESV